MAAQTNTSSVQESKEASPWRALLKRARSAESRPRLPNLSALGKNLRKAVSVLSSLDPALRPRLPTGDPGKLLTLPPELPVLVLPDLHTRAGLLWRALEWMPPGETQRFAEMLSEGKALLLLLGDLVHSEGLDAPWRWREAYGEYLEGFAEHAAMDQEMGRGLGALDILARAVILASGRVLCLKGNHDNSRNREGWGDHGFYKFADEGAMCALWLELFSEEDVREALIAFEEALPLAALGGRFAASHGEPAFPMSREELMLGGPEVVEGLIWTANGDALPGSVEETLKSLGCPEREGFPIPWIAGHRPVAGRYALRQEGRLVQIHNPFSFQAAWILPDRPFDPESDIHLL